MRRVSYRRRTSTSLKPCQLGGGLHASLRGVTRMRSLSNGSTRRMIHKRRGQEFVTPSHLGKTNWGSGFTDNAMHIGMESYLSPVWRRWKPCRCGPGSPLVLGQMRRSILRTATRTRHGPMVRWQVQAPQSQLTWTEVAWLPGCGLACRVPGLPASKYCSCYDTPA